MPLSHWHSLVMVRPVVFVLACWHTVTYTLLTNTHTYRLSRQTPYSCDNIVMSTGNKHQQITHITDWQLLCVSLLHISTKLGRNTWIGVHADRLEWLISVKWSLFPKNSTFWSTLGVQLWYLTFWPQMKWVTRTLSCSIHLPSLIMIRPVVFVLECWYACTHTHTNKCTEQINALRKR